MTISPATVVFFVLLFGATAALLGYFFARAQDRARGEQPARRSRPLRRAPRRSITSSKDVFATELRLAGVGRGQLPYAGYPERKLLAEAPRVDRLTLHEWLLEQKHGTIWQETVSTLYDRCRRDVVLGVFFKDTDLAKLQKHFLATLLIVTHTGLTVETARAMYSAHRGLTDDRGGPITHGVFDRFVETLGGALKDVGVRDLTIGDVVEILEILRPLLVRPDAPLPPPPRRFALEATTNRPVAARGHELGAHSEGESDSSP